MTKAMRTALRALRAGEPVPRKEFNPGVSDKLVRDGLATWVWMDSPYKTHRKGIQVLALQITAVGRLAAGGHAPS